MQPTISSCPFAAPLPNLSCLGVTPHPHFSKLSTFGLRISAVSLFFLGGGGVNLTQKVHILLTHIFLSLTNDKNLTVYNIQYTISVGRGLGSVGRQLGSVGRRLGLPPPKSDGPVSAHLEVLPITRGGIRVLGGLGQSYGQFW